jgi:dTMP kinase
LRRGVFITFEGIDGCGKTTQIERLVKRLRAEGYEVEETVEPGGTPVGRQIRRILLDFRNQELSPRTELLLYFASRAQNVDQRIRPALEHGRIVVSDRYTDSTLVYQGIARGLGEDVVARLHEIACGDVHPDLTICLDISLETSLERARARNRELTGDRAVETRMDEQSTEFYRSVREGYRELAGREPARFRIVDGGGDVNEVAAAVWTTVADKLAAVAGAGPRPGIGA